jgi:hypothetical protein
MARFVKTLKSNEKVTGMVKRCLVFGKNEKVGAPKKTVGEILGECEELRTLWVVGAVGVENFCAGTNGPQHVSRYLYADSCPKQARHTPLSAPFSSAAPRFTFKQDSSGLLLALQSAHHLLLYSPTSPPSTWAT